MGSRYIERPGKEMSDGAWEAMQAEIAAHTARLEQEAKDSQAQYIEEAFQRRMGAVARGLVEALRSPDDPRDQEEMTAAVVEALRPLDERIEAAANRVSISDIIIR